MEWIGSGWMVSRVNRLERIELRLVIGQLGCSLGIREATKEAKQASNDYGHTRLDDWNWPVAKLGVREDALDG